MLHHDFRDLFLLLGESSLQNMLHHFVHGFCGRLPDNDIKGLSRHDEAHRLMQGCAHPRCVVYRGIAVRKLGDNLVL